TDGAYELLHYDYDGVSSAVFSGTTVDLANLGTDGADRIDIRWGTDSAATVQLDDIFACDGSGDVNNDLPTEPWVVLGALPTSDGNESDWTPSTGSDHYALVDDAANSPGETGHIRSFTSGDVDLFG